MLHYYCYVENIDKFTPKTRVYRVKVGNNHRDQVKRCLLDNYSCDTGAFWRQWDADTEFLLQKLSCRFISDCGQFRPSFEIIEVSISVLYRAIIDDSLSTIQNPPRYYKNLFRSLSVISPSFRATNYFIKKPSPAPTRTRKNLSVGSEIESVKVAISFCLILALFLLAGYLEGIERIY